MKHILASWAHAAAKAAEQRHPCVYSGLAHAPEKLRHGFAGLRLAGLSLFLLSNGLPLTLYTSLVHLVDSWLPGELGELHHSRFFVYTFRKAAIEQVRQFQLWDVHAKLCALGIKSDYAWVSDGITTSCGTPLHIHIMIQEGRGGKLQYHLLGLQPVQSIARNDEAIAFASALRFSTKGALIEHTHTIEQQFQLQGDVAFRFAGRAGDGAEEGPTGAGLASHQAAGVGLGRHSDLFGMLDQFHACEVAGEHADGLVANLDKGYRDQFVQSAQSVRARFGYGAASVLPNAVSKKFQLRCWTLLAPRSSATRTLKQESVVCALNHLRNVKTIGVCYMISVSSQAPGLHVVCSGFLFWHVSPAL